MKHMKRLFFLMGVLGTLLVLTACGSKKEEAKTASEKKNMEFNMYLNSGIKTLDISKATDVNSSTIFTQIMEGLTRVTVGENGEDKIVPGIAESWDISEDGMTWVFHLKDSKWWDGKPVTAHDFEYSIKRTLDPITASAYAFILAPILNATEYNSGKADRDSVGVRAIDDKTLEFKLKSPCGYFLNLAYYKSLYPQRKDIVEEHGDRYGAVEDTIIANGPFKLTEWVPNNKIVLVKNDNYWDASNVKLDKVNISIVSDTNAQMNMLLNGQVDMSGVDKQEWIQKFESTNKYNVIKGYTAGTNYSFFNQTDSIFKNDKVRKAFSLAIDREDMGEVIFKGVMEPAYGWTPPRLQIGDKEYRKLTNEPLRQLKEENPDPKALLIEGLKELGITTPIEELEISYLNSSTNDWAKNYFEYTQQMYKKALGVQIKGEFVEWPVFQKRVDEQDFQVAGMAWTGDYNDPSTFLDIWVSDSGIYNIGYENNRYDELVKTAAVTIDNNKRLEYFAEAENILLYEDSAIAPTLYRKRNTFIDKKVKGMVIALFGGVSLKSVYIEE